jgi:hypothetical protein
MRPMRLGLVLLVVGLGCGDDGPGTATGGSGGGGAAGSGGAGGTLSPDAGVDAAAGGGGQGGVAADAGRDQGAGEAGPPGACTRDSDCPPIQCLVPPCDPVVCVLSEGGVRRCETRTRPALQTCPAMSQLEMCCRSDAECTMKPNGHCIPFAHGYCGGAAPMPGNTCRYDACTSDADCTAMPNGFCTAGWERTCQYGPCRTNADCNKSPGGTCVLATANAGYCPRPAVFCRYPNDPCRSDSDCRGASINGLVCNTNPDLHGTRCVDRGVPPP